MPEIRAAADVCGAAPALFASENAMEAACLRVVNLLRRAIFALLLLCSGIEAALAAGWSELGSTVRPGAAVTVAMMDGKIVEGRFQSASESAITLKAKGEVKELARAQVASISGIRRKSMKKKILIGTAIGAGAGAGLGTAAGGCQAHDIICFERSSTIPIAAAVGAVIGAVTGLGLGLMSHEKFVLYATP